MHYYGTIIGGESLAHHGVIGMRWGIRHDRRVKSSKRGYKAKRKALKRNKSISKKQRRYRVKQAKGKWMNEREKAANRLYPLNSKGLNRKLARDTSANTLAKAAIFGDQGTVAYDSQRGRGRPRIVAATAGAATRAAVHVPVVGKGVTGASYAYYFANRRARKKG